MIRPQRPPAEAPTLVPMPDRSLDTSGDLPVVAVRSPGYHPFVYRKMVIGPVGGSRPMDGDIVRVVDRENLPLGFGLWNGRSQISLRLLSQGVDPPTLEFWTHRIDRAIALRRETLGLDAVTNAYRVLHAEGDGLSGLIVDRFDDVLSAEIFSLGMYQRIGPILALIAERLGTKHVRVNVDERIAMAEDFSGRPVVSPKLPPRVTIQENGVRYRVVFEGSHKTGFFCDQRDNRQALLRYTPGRSMLDVCCYTGGFGISALTKGGATEVTGVDLDEKAIARARDNGNLNQVRPTYVHADAFGYLRQMRVNERAFGVVVLDPPKLIPGRLDIATGKQKYFDMNFLAMSVVEPGGFLLTCSCSGLLSPEEFLHLLRAAARKAGRSAQVLAVTGASPDHPVGLDALEGAYLKGVWLRMGEKTGVVGSSTFEDDDRIEED
ncbi:23S rRNA (cytosine1962-C5)-methyltransferase [Singulisphaera sp. GP187]|uniref:class I SAM-dependent rRNA methyltransferase n=1 Tax=Singulisphaera sp. GP187 TaxID=1882752 RepID=UPI0009290C42|nr:class I SAM-dependent rRNA methyltransferase [Singulisphaera sp. GP187]SIN81861.1 23S rRNA (cytosine1962-C5)-methyltransferase [Singulisphaera sp. GP187]